MDTTFLGALLVHDFGEQLAVWSFSLCALIMCFALLMLLFAVHSLHELSVMWKVERNIGDIRFYL